MTELLVNVDNLDRILCSMIVESNHRKGTAVDYSERRFTDGQCDALVLVRELVLLMARDQEAAGDQE